MKIEHLKVRLIQAVDVAMFSSGYFKVKTAAFSSYIIHSLDVRGEVG